MALLECSAPVEGQKVVAFRKLLYLEKLFGSLLLAFPRISDQLAVRVNQLKDSHDPTSVILHSLMVGLQTLGQFYLPLAFRLGNAVRSCTWEGRQEKSGSKARFVLEACAVTLIHLLQDVKAKNEYVRTLLCALATWQPFMEGAPACVFAEETCEALLSRLSHRCDVNRHLHGFDATYNLFLTLPSTSWAPRNTRGSLKIGLVDLFASRFRRLLHLSVVPLLAPPVAPGTMHSQFVLMTFPLDLPTPLPSTFSPDVMVSCMAHAMLCLTRKSSVSQDIQTHLGSTCPPSLQSQLDEYDAALRLLKKHALGDSRPVRKILAPKRKAKPAPGPHAFEASSSSSAAMGSPLDSGLHLPLLSLIKMVLLFLF